MPTRGDMLFSCAFFLLACASADLGSSGSRPSSAILDDDDYDDPPKLPGESPTPSDDPTQTPQTPSEEQTPGLPGDHTAAPTPSPNGVTASPSWTLEPSLRPVNTPLPETSPKPLCELSFSISHPAGTIDAEGPLYIQFFAASPEQTPSPSADATPIHQITVSLPYSFPLSVETTLLFDGDAYADLWLDSDDEGEKGPGDCLAQTSTFSTHACPLSFEVLLACEEESP